MRSRNLERMGKKTNEMRLPCLTMPPPQITRYARALILALFDACREGRPNSPPCPVNLSSYELLTTEWPVLCHLTSEPQSQNPAASVEHGDKSPSAQLTTQQTCETSLQFFGIGGFRVRLPAALNLIHSQYAQQEYSPN